MAMNKKALNAYHNVHVAAVPYADGIQLIQMLFDGLIDSLSSAEGEIKRKNIQEKCCICELGSFERRTFFIFNNMSYFFNYSDCCFLQRFPKLSLNS